MSGAVPLTVSPETTIITEPLKSDGTVDYHQHLQTKLEQGVHPDDNGFKILVLAYGREIFDTEEQYLEMCKRLGIDLLAPSTIEPGLDTVQDAAAKQRYFIPLIRQSEKDLVLLSQPFAVYAFHEKISQSLRQRAESRFRAGDIDGAWKDTLASMRLFRFVTVNQAWIKTLGGQNADSMLTQTPELTSTLERWSTEQLQQAIKDLESLPDWQERKTTLQTMQFCLLDLMSSPNDLVERYGSAMPKDKTWILDRFQFIGFDWNLVAIELNQYVKSYEEDLEKRAADVDALFDFLRMGEVRNNPGTWDENKWMQIAEGDPTMLFYASKRSKLTGAIAGKILIPWVAGEMFRLEIMEESRCQALRLAMALELYRKQNGRYPDSQEELNLKPMKMDMRLRYEKQGGGYRIENKVFLQSRNL
jgi:hypothetical protein